MSYGVQTDGTFDKKPVDEIRDDIKQDFLNELGQDIELRPSSPVVQVINAVSLELAKQWNSVEGSYYASFYEDSFGEQLDKQLALAGFQRKSLRGATGEVTFSRDSAATQDVTIPEGTVVQAPRTQTRPRIPFKTTEQATIFTGDMNVTEVPIEALEPWETEVDAKWLGEETNLNANAITEFGDPLSGVDSVNNPNPTGDTTLDYTEGRDEETDAEFKNRYEASLASGGKATRDAIRSELFAANPDVVSVDVEEIHDPANDEYGARVTVLAPGVGDDVIAQALFDSIAAGMDSFGNSSGTATSDSGDTETEYFDRATEQSISIDATVTTDSTYEPDAETQIIDRLIRFIGGEDSEGVQFPGLGIGENVIFDQVFRRIINQQGVVEVELDIGPTGGTLDKDNIAVSSTEAATLDATDVTITEA